MAQFRRLSQPKRGAFPLLLDVQTDLLASLATRVVVPMSRVHQRAAKPISRLNPVADIDGVTYALVFKELAAIPSAVLGERVTSLATRRVELIAALDLRLTGS